MCGRVADVLELPFVVTSHYKCIERLARRIATDNELLEIG
jgi:hypothetical protein